jgi:hypothetical protein
MNRNLVGSIYGRSSITIAHFVLICNKKEEFEDTKVSQMTTDMFRLS